MNDEGKEGQELKYFMKSINGVFKESYDDNSAIINNPKNGAIYRRDLERDLKDENNSK
jgi:5-methylcytosine-specific restriction protein A